MEGEKLNEWFLVFLYYYHNGSSKWIHDHLRIYRKGKLLGRCVLQVVTNSVYHSISAHSTTLFVCFWRHSPQWARASSFTRFLDHTQRRTTVGRTPLDEWSEISTWQHTPLTKDKHPFPGGIRTHNLSRWAAADQRLRPRGHWDRRQIFNCRRKLHLRDIKYYSIWNNCSTSFEPTTYKVRLHLIIAQTLLLPTTNRECDKLWPGRRTALPYVYSLSALCDLVFLSGLQVNLFLSQNKCLPVFNLICRFLHNHVSTEHWIHSVKQHMCMCVCVCVCVYIHIPMFAVDRVN
jgi:hypothetical protein